MTDAHASSHVAIVVFARDPAREPKRLGLGRRRDRAVLSAALDHALQVVRQSASPAERPHSSAATGYDLFLASDDVRAEGFEVLPQRSGGFEARFIGALRDVFARGYRRAVIVGTDTPSLCVSDIVDAASAAEPVVGPSVDGGFYLLALGPDEVDRLTGLPWQTNTLFEQLWRRMADRQVRRGVDRVDVDDAGSWSRLPATLRRRLLAATRACKTVIEAQRTSYRPTPIRFEAPSLAPPS